MLKKYLLWIVVLLLMALIILYVTASGLMQDVPTPPSYKKVRAEYQVSDAVLLDRHGQVIHELRIDPQGRRLDWVDLKDISPSFIKTLIYAEDRRFYGHNGVDWRAVGGAFLQGMRTGKFRGASTITMQLAARLEKTARPRLSRRTWREKIRQAKVAQSIERTWTKKEILEAYVNLITFKGELQGIAAASRGIFDKEPGGLTDRDSLILVSLIPSTHSGLESIAGRSAILGRALEVAVSPDEIKALVQETVGRPYRLRPQMSLAPHVARMLLTESGQRVKSTIDGRLQESSYEILNRQLDMLKDRNVHDGAVIVVENATGEVLAYIGNSGATSSSPYVDGIRALRQAGSTLKPFLYELALEKRMLTAASIIEDSPFQVATPTGLYVPENYGNDFLGPVSVRTALSSSLNIPAVRTVAMTGIEPFVSRLKKLGFESIRKDADYYGHSIALGSVDISLAELVNAYRVMANGGRFGILTLEAGKGRKPLKRVLDRDAVFIISSILSDREARSATFGLENYLSTRFWTAVKTGTSKDMRDNWCIGFSEKFTVGVWVGNFSGEPMWNVTGISGAAPVWLEVMNRLHPRGDSKNPKPTPGVTAREISFSHRFEPQRTEWFIRGTEPEDKVTLNVQHETRTIIYPAEGSIISLDPDIPEDNQSIAFQVQGRAGRIIWELDSEIIGSESTMMWKPRRGVHVLSVMDESKKLLDTVRFTVK